MKLKRFAIGMAAAGLIAWPWLGHAAGLGKLAVKSALGQPLVAEIEVLAADRAELDSLAANLASDQAFRDARVEFAPVLGTLRFAIDKKPDGKAVLRITSTAPVNDPFIDMLIELNWASGRLVREYTVLLDPPAVATPQTVAPVAPVAVAPASAPAPASAKTPAPAAESKAAPAGATARKPAAEGGGAKPAAAGEVRVKRGDTLMTIARQVKPANVALEQALVGLFKENTPAFEGGNMNRLKAGAKLKVPPGEALAAIDVAEARREIRLQADDWRAYRQKLAEAVAKAPAPAQKPESGQTAAGKIAPRVEERVKPEAQAPKDVLKLSKGAPPAAGAAAAAKEAEAQALKEKLRAQEEDATAREKALKESSERVAMLEKQVQDMQKLVEMKARAAREATPQPVASLPPVVATPAVPAASGHWYDPLVDNPLYWAGGAAVVGLGGLLWWMTAGGRRRKPAAAFEDSIMSGADVQPTVVAGASGGSINTGDTSFLTDFSQAGLGTIDTHDVDPIAEAEVYMAYGRDAQAEEILKEAIPKYPERHEIRLKLLEIYAARRNPVAFEKVAGELFAAIGNTPNSLWEKAAEMGRSIDPTNPLYGGAGKEAAAAKPAPEPEAPAAAAAAAAVAGAAAAFAGAAGGAETPVAQAAAQAEPETGPVTASAPLEFESPGSVLDFDAGARAEAPPAEPHTKGLDFDLSDLEVPAGAHDEIDLDLGLADDNGPDSQFDFSGLDLDLGEEAGDTELDEVATKLDLARAYLEMGDKEGAREILNEVLAEGNDRQKGDARSLLDTLA